MSTIVMSLCWPLQLQPTAKAVLISLADNANDHGECWPSIAKISERTCFSERAVQRAIGLLELEGLLVADRTNGRHTRYTLTPAHLAPRISGTPRRSDTNPRTSGVKPPPDMPSNRKEPSPTANTLALDFSSWPTPPSPQVLADWIAHRKKKRAPISVTVLEAFGRELHKAAAMVPPIDVDTCLATAMQRNWQGLNADWLLPAADQRGSAPASTRPAYSYIDPRTETPEQKARKTREANEALAKTMREAGYATEA